MRPAIVAPAHERGVESDARDFDTGLTTDDTVLKSVLVAPATRTVRNIPTELALTRAEGMPEDCALSFDNLATVPKTLLTERIMRVLDAKLDELCRALRAATGW